MYWLVPGILDAASREEVDLLRSNLTWKEGAKTAGAQARQVKDNLQADLSTSQGQTLTALVTAALQSNAIIRAAARPHAFSPLMVSRTENGGQYGPHVDNAIMASGTLRTDLSYTLFLSDPQQYEGGELCLDLPAGVQLIKCKKGDLVLYPSTLIHWVAPVTTGQRDVVVGWIQSLVADASERELLFDLEAVRNHLRTREAVGSPALLTLDKTISNLLRKWSRFS